MIANLVIFSLLVFSFGREFARNYIIQQEIAELTAEKATMEAENSELTTFMSSVQTETYIEQEARIKLGLSKPGESVVILSGLDSVSPSNNGDALTAAEVDSLSVPDLNALANPLKWWYYFFDINKFDMIKIYGNHST